MKALNIACIEPVQTITSSAANSNPFSRRNLARIASFRAGVPSALVYCVSPRKAAAWAAATTCAGVGQSSSPEPSTMTSWPAASRARVRCRRREAGEASIWRKRDMAHRSGVLCLAVAERPVLLVHLHQVDEHVLRPDARTVGQTFDDGAIQLLLLCDGARVADRELEDDEVVAAVDPGIVRIEIEAVGVMLAHQHEAVIERDLEGFAHGGVDAVADGLAVLRRLAPPKRNANEWHG